MRSVKYASLLAIAGTFLLASPPHCNAQISAEIGPAPVCPYGYYDYSPYNCAPYGYYGPQWFDNGIFIGAGPWFHGPGDFRGNVDNHYDVRHGYHGRLPRRGEHVRRHDSYDFKANAVSDGRGHDINERGNHGDNDHQR